MDVVGHVVARVPVRHMVEPQFAMAGRATDTVAVGDAVDAFVEMRPAFRAADTNFEVPDRIVHVGLQRVDVRHAGGQPQAVS
jgi:hypothetical protein